MPIGNFKCVRETSSEDNIHRAENLLRQQPGKTWKTKSGGEKSAYVILEFEESKQITGIDIGNEHAAFVEILVNESCSGEFKELLMTSSLMTPFESKGSTNINRVRCFGQDSLTSTLLTNKWKFVKIICTQPFNQHVQYGLAFIKVHVLADVTAEKTEKVKSLVPEKFLNNITSIDKKEKNENEAALKTIKKIGRFTLRADSTDSESNGTTNFNRWKNRDNGEKPTTTAAASIRDASNAINVRNIASEENVEKVEVAPEPKKEVNEDKKEPEKKKHEKNNRNASLFGESDDEQSSHKTKSPATKNEHKKVVERSSTIVQKTDKNGTHGTRAEKRRSSPKKTPAKKPKICKPFNQLLNGVVLVISGIQNPLRTDLRNKALALGAKYRSDWGHDSTHLICAFKHTPKYNQVKGHGKIITSNWILDCYNSKKYLPWRRYALRDTDTKKSESDEEICIETERQENSIDIKTTRSNTSSGSDTDDDINRVLQQNKLKKEIKKRVDSDDDDIFDATTEEEDYVKIKFK